MPEIITATVGAGQVEQSDGVSAVNSTALTMEDSTQAIARGALLVIRATANTNPGADVQFVLWRRPDAVSLREAAPDLAAERKPIICDAFQQSPEVIHVNCETLTDSAELDDAAEFASPFLWLLESPEDPERTSVGVVLLAVVLARAVQAILYGARMVTVGYRCGSAVRQRR